MLNKDAACRTHNATIQRLSYLYMSIRLGYIDHTLPKSRYSGTGRTYKAVKEFGQQAEDNKLVSIK